MNTKTKGTVSAHTLPKSNKTLNTEGIAQNNQTKTGATHTRPDSSDKSRTIPKNINFYRHLIDSVYANESGVEWVLKLRSPTESDLHKKLDTSSANPPSFYGKSLESQTQKRSTIDLENNIGSLHEVRHLLFHRIGPTPTRSQALFETGLRSYGSTPQLKELERKFTTIPKKDKKGELPRLYPSYNETNKIKNWSTKNLSIKTYPAFEGYLNYPKYTDLLESQPKNMSETRHLYYPGQLMSTVSWELSMREYGDRSRKKKELQESIKALKNKASKVTKK